MQHSSHLPLMLAALLLSACAHQPRNVALQEDTQGDCPLQLDQGQRLDISLPSNPSTGFRWEVVKAAPKVLHSLGPEVYSNPEDVGLVGAAGRSTWHFQATETGEDELLLQYRRPWEQGVAPANSFACVISVE